MNNRYSVMPYRYYRRDDGRTASIFGACPWVSAAEEIRWSLVDGGFTVWDSLTNTSGLGRVPFKSRTEADAFVSKINAQA